MQSKFNNLDKRVKGTQSSIDAMSKSAVSGMNATKTATEKTIQEVNKIIAKYGDLKGAMQGVSDKATLSINTAEVKQDLSDIEQLIKDLYQELDEKQLQLDAGVDTDEYKELLAEIASINGELDDAEEEAKQLKAQLIMGDTGIVKSTKAIEQMKLELFNTSEALAKAKADLEKMAMVDAGSDETQEQIRLVGQLESQYRKLYSMIQQSRTGIVEATGASVWQTLGNEIKKVQGNVQKFAQTANKITKPFQKVAEYAGKAGLAISKFAMKLNPIPKTVDKLSRAFKTLREKIVAAFIYSAINTWFNNIRNQISSYLKADSELKAALGRNTGAWLTAFQPIYEVVVPALVTLLNWLTKVGYALAAFTSQLTGKTVKQSQEGAKSLWNQANALEATGAAAKEAKKQLASFDELNVLQGQDAGGGGASSEIAPEFGEIPEVEKFSSWGEAFSDILDKIIAKLPSFNNAMENAAMKINDFSKNFNEMLEYNGVQGKIATIASGLAEGFNTLTDTIDWYQLGQSVGLGIQSALNFALNFIRTYKWANLGKGIAEGINGALSKIKGRDLGELLISPFNIAIKTLNGFLQNLDWAQVGKTLADCIEGIVSSIDIESAGSVLYNGLTGIATMIDTFLEETDWGAISNRLSQGFQSIFNNTSAAIQNIDWGSLVKNILNAVYDIVANFDWAGFFSSVFELIGSVLGATTTIVTTLASAVGELIVKALDEAVNYFREQIESCGGNIILGVLKGIVNALVGIGKWIVDNVLTPFIDGFKKAFQINSPSKIMEEQGGYIIDGLLAGIKNAWDKLMSWVTDTFENFKTFCKDTWEDIKNKAKTNWEKISTEITNKVSGIKTKAEEKWGEMKTNLVNKIDEFKKDASTKWDEVKTTLTTKFTDIKNDGVKTFTNMKTSLVNIFTQLGTALKTPINAIIDVINGLINGAVTGINKVIDAINKISFTVPTNDVTEWLGIAGKGWSGFNIKHVTGYTIPKLADGGIITQPTLAMMGEYANARNNPEIVAPESLMKQVFEASNGSVVDALIQQTRQLLAGLEEISMEVSIGDETIAKAAQRGNQAYKRRTGRPLFA